MHANSFAPYLCNDPHFSTSLSASSTGRWGKRLSEVTSLINKLARHTSARRTICSRLVFTQRFVLRWNRTGICGGNLGLLTVCVRWCPAFMSLHELVKTKASLYQRGRIQKSVQSLYQCWCLNFWRRLTACVVVISCFSEASVGFADLFMVLLTYSKICD